MAESGGRQAAFQNHHALAAFFVGVEEVFDDRIALVLAQPRVWHGQEYAVIHAVQLRKAQFLHLFVVVERPAQHVDGANADLAVRAHVPHHDQLAAGQGKGLAVVQRNGVPHFARLRVPLRAHARRVEDVQPADRA